MKKIFAVIICISMLCSLGIINVSAVQKESLSIEKVENSDSKLEIEKITSDSKLLEIFNSVKDKAANFIFRWSKNYFTGNMKTINTVFHYMEQAIVQLSVKMVKLRSR